MSIDAIIFVNHIVQVPQIIKSAGYKLNKAFLQIHLQELQNPLTSPSALAHAIICFPNINVQKSQVRSSYFLFLAQKAVSEKMLKVAFCSIDYLKGDEP
jgi:hypothetical protein